MNDDGGDGSDEDTGVKRDGMTKITMFAFSIGHLFNDQTMTLWCVYVAWYLEKVVKLEGSMVGMCMNAVEISGALATLIVGFGSDSCNTRCGKRNPWFIIGLVMAFPSFFGIFIYPEFVNERTQGEYDEGLRTAWYITLPIMYSMGWYITNIAHMSIVNDLSLSNSRRDKMINDKNVTYFAARIFTILLALIIFFIYDQAREDNPAPITDPFARTDKEQADIDQWRVILYISCGIGACSSIFYLYQI